MKTFSILILSISLTSCAMMNQMNDLVNQSSESIRMNQEAVERSTAAIRQNAQLVNQSTQTIQENKRLLESAAGAQ